MKTRKSYKNRVKAINRIIKQSSIEDFNLLNNDIPQLPQELMKWLLSLKNLQGVPFNYLVPHENMLPNESIRFFYIDSGWLTCLLEGAASIGRCTSSDKAHDLVFQQQIYDSLGLNKCCRTGFLLRSYVVKGWPGVGIVAKDVDDNVLSPIRIETVAPDVMLGIFDGVISKLYIHEAFDIIHFGIDNSGSKQLKYITSLGEGKQTGQSTGVHMDVSPYVQYNGVLRVSELASAIKGKLHDLNIYSGELSSAEFALEMTEGVQQVCFTIDLDKQGVK